MMRSLPFFVFAAGLSIGTFFSSQSDAPSKSARTHATSSYPASQIQVIDGDTVAIAGERYRFLGFDTPETFRAQCDSERNMGLRAKARLTHLIVGAGGLELQVSNRPDKYGRKLATAFTNGQDVADVLISEGLARPYNGGTRHPWCGKEGPEQF